MSSASGVVGPFAPSATSLALMLRALFSVMTSSSAADTSMSTSSSRSSSFEMFSVPERADNLGYEREECSGETLQFVFGQEFRVNRDASFRASERYARDRALPRHPH